MKPINNPRPIKTVPAGSVAECRNPMRLQIKSDSAPRSKSSDYRTDALKVARARKLEDLAEAERLGMSYDEYMESVK